MIAECENQKSSAVERGRWLGDEEAIEVMMRTIDDLPSASCRPPFLELSQGAAAVAHGVFDLTR